MPTFATTTSRSAEADAFEAEYNKAAVSQKDEAASFEDELQTRQLFRQGMSEKVLSHPLISGTEAIEDDDERAKLANSVFIAHTYNVPIGTALANHDGVIGQLFGEGTKPMQAFVKIRDAYKTDQEKFDEYHANTPWKQETADWLSGSWAQMKLQFSGLVEATTDVTGGKKLNEWSQQMRKGVYEDMQVHPEKFLRPPGIGFWETTSNYLKHPEYIAWGVTEQVPLIIASVVSGGMAGASAKAVGATAKGVKAAAWAGRVQGFAVPIFGSNYSDLRQQNVEPMRAFPEAFLRAQGEALLEEWTLSKKLSLFKATGSQAKRGIGELTAKYLLDKPVLRGGYGVASAYSRGAFEEGTQRINDNFWSIVFRDVDTTLFDGVANAAAAGGILELSMTGVFKAGARIKEKTTGVKMVSLDEQLARIEVIREEINKAPMSPEHKAEVNAEIDAVRTQVEEGKWTPAPPAAKEGVPSEAEEGKVEVSAKEQFTGEVTEKAFDKITATKKESEALAKKVSKEFETVEPFIVFDKTI